MLQVQGLDLGPRPGRSSEKAQAGRQTGIVGETAYGDAPAHFRPAQAFDQFGQHLFQRNAMKRIVDLWCSHLPDIGFARLRSIISSLSDQGRSWPPARMTRLQNKLRIRRAAVTEYN